MKFRAAVLEEFRRPFVIREVDLSPSNDEVPVRVVATGLCGRDIVVWRGGFRNLRTPLILGHEVVGVDQDGRPVAVYPGLVPPECRSTDNENFCQGYTILGEGKPGGYAEYVFVPRWNLVSLQGGEPEQYAAAACGVATFIHASKVAGVRPGDRVLVTGATGGTGIHGVQYLVKVLGAHVYGFSRSPEKARLLEGLGVKPVTSFSFYKDEGKVDFVFEVVGGPTINDSMLSLRERGTLVLIGNITGEPIALERPAFIVMRELKITGTAAYTKREFEEAIKLIGEGAIRPFYRTYRLDQINEAYEDALNGRLVGRAVIKP